MSDDEASLAMARLNVSGSDMVATVTDPPGWPMAYSNVSAFRRNSAMRSQSNSSELRRDCRPSGPWTHVRCPSVKPVQLSTLRHTIRPPVVCCRASCSIGRNCSFSKQAPTVSGPSAASISDLSVANPRTNWQSPVAAAGVASATSSNPATINAINLFFTMSLLVRVRCRTGQ